MAIHCRAIKNSLRRTVCYVFVVLPIFGKKRNGYADPVMQTLVVLVSLILKIKEAKLLLKEISYRTVLQYLLPYSSDSLPFLVGTFTISRVYFDFEDTSFEVFMFTITATSCS
jgi:hypothetical protein